MVSDMRVQCIALLKSTLEYTIEDIDDAALFAMVSLITNEAQKAAVIRNEKAQQREYQEQYSQLVGTNVAMSSQRSKVTE